MPRLKCVPNRIHRLESLGLSEADDDIFDWALWPSAWSPAGTDPSIRALNQQPTGNKNVRVPKLLDQLHAEIFDPVYGINQKIVSARCFNSARQWGDTGHR